jgi:hypothetical protein
MAKRKGAARHPTLSDLLNVGCQNRPETQPMLTKPIYGCDLIVQNGPDADDDAPTAPL